MQKRKINTEYLRHITATYITDTRLDALDFALSIKSFAEEYLEGIMTVRIIGKAHGYLKLRFPVVSYLIRLLSECCDSGTVDLSISLSDALLIESALDSSPTIEDASHIVKVARLAGFKVDRCENTFLFRAPIEFTEILRIYATSSDEFREMLVTTYKM